MQTANRLCIRIHGAQFQLCCHLRIQAQRSLLVQVAWKVGKGNKDPINNDKLPSVCAASVSSMLKYLCRLWASRMYKCFGTARIRGTRVIY